jgi:hypothetical protein
MSEERGQRVRQSESGEEPVVDTRHPAMRSKCGAELNRLL